MNLRTVWIVCAALPLLMGLGAGTSLEQAPGGQKFAPGETLTYDVNWSIFTAGRITATLLGPAQGRPPSEIVTAARSQGFASLLYKVDDEYHSVLSPETLCSRRISKKVNEGSHHKQIDVTFDAGRGVAVTDERDQNTPNAPLKHTENKIPPCVQDIVSAFYFLRHQTFRVGQDIRLPVNDGGETREVVVEVQSKDQLQTALGARAAFRVEPKVFGSLYNKKGRMLVWFSDDAQHLPLRIRMTISVGTITGNLKSVTAGPAR